MTAWSLRRRLLAWLFIATLVMGVAALADTWREARRTAQGVSDRVLAGSALAIAERVTIDEGGGLQVDIPFSALEMLASTAQDQVFYRVDGPPGTFLTGYDTLTPLAGEGTVFADARMGAVPIRVATLTRRITTGEGSVPVAVTVAESTLARDALARSILVRSALRLLAMGLAAAAIVWVAVTLALRPLDRLGEALALRSPGDLSPLTAATPDEVAGLVTAINSFMARLDAALGGLRNFTGNASHQLRTPLATVRAQLSLAARGADPAAMAEAAAKADAALARAERVLAQLLVLARVDAAEGAGLVAVDAAALGREVVAELVPAAARGGVDLGYEGEDRAPVRAEPVLLAELMRNLLDNAIRHAGRGSVVTLRTLAAPDGVILEVEDNGPGLPDARRAALASPRRGAPRADASAGYGLGLAIVQEIAALFSAPPRFDAGPGGRGLSVRLRLARA